MRGSLTIFAKLMMGVALLLAAAVGMTAGEARADFTSTNFVDLGAFQNTLTPYPQFDVSSGSGVVDFQDAKTGHIFTITSTASNDLTTYRGSSGQSNTMLGGQFNINISAWENGSTWTVGSGSAGNDLTVTATGFTGGSNPPQYSGTLLTGTLESFGIKEVSETGTGIPTIFWNSISR